MPRVKTWSPASAHPNRLSEMEREMPEIYRQLVELRNRLEEHYKEVQDYEYTIEKGVLYCLQTRNGKMNATALVRTSVEMVKDGLIDKHQSLLRIQPEMLEQLLFPRLDPKAKAKPVAKGLPASPGAASGIAVFDADRAEKLGRAGEKVILVREETKPEDIHGFFASQGILTSRGGKTSHAAVVARGMGKPCVAGAEGIHVDVHTRQAIVGDQAFGEGAVITIDGTTGHVFIGEVAMIEAEFSSELGTLLSWADETARLKVMANADTPHDADRALNSAPWALACAGPNACSMPSSGCPLLLRSSWPRQRPTVRTALNKLLPIQREDFAGIFKVMAPRPVTIRLLDPPIHEFLPSENQLVAELNQLWHLRDTLQGMQVLSDSIDFMYRTRDTHPSVQMPADPALVEEAIQKKEAMLKKVRALFEVNPMLGHRGVRLGLTYPEIYSMQIRAILEAAAECQKAGIEVASGNHGATGLHRPGIEASQGMGGGYPSRCRGRVQGQTGLQFWLHARGRQSLHEGREPGRGSRILFIRHQ